MSQGRELDRGAGRHPQSPEERAPGAQRNGSGKDKTKQKKKTEKGGSELPTDKKRVLVVVARQRARKPTARAEPRGIGGEPEGALSHSVGDRCSMRTRTKESTRLKRRPFLLGWPFAA